MLRAEPDHHSAGQDTGGRGRPFPIHSVSSAAVLRCVLAARAPALPPARAPVSLCLPWRPADVYCDAAAPNMARTKAGLATVDYPAALLLLIQILFHVLSSGGQHGRLDSAHPN